MMYNMFNVDDVDSEHVHGARLLVDYVDAMVW